MNTQVLKAELFSIPISITSKSGALAIITQWVMEGQGMKARGQGKKMYSSSFSPKIVVTPNPEMIVAAQRDSEFLQALKSADLSIADGWGVVIAVRLLQRLKAKGQRPKELSKSMSCFPLSLSPYPLALYRISGLSLMEDLVALAAQNGWRVMLVGGRPGVAERAAELLRHEYQVSSIKYQVNAIEGPGDVQETTEDEMSQLIISINKYKPDLLFVAFGHGKQEKWLSAHRYRLHAGVAMGVGGAFDQIVDPSLRPPAFADRIGFGWLYRLLREPWRWRRQMVLLTFAGMVCTQVTRRKKE